MPAWVSECYRDFLRADNRLPTMRELLLWRKTFALTVEPPPPPPGYELPA
jgi:hypothetical protein